MSFLDTPSRRVPRAAFAHRALRTSPWAVAVALLLATARSERTVGVLRRRASGLARYRHFVTLTQVSRPYGARTATRPEFLRDIDTLGLSAGVDPSGVFARVSGTVNQLDRIFHVHLQSARPLVP